MTYENLEEKLPRVLHNKPRWMYCLAFTAAVLVITLSAVTIGVFFGYTYCYIEHQVGFQTGNPLESASLQIVRIPFLDNEEARYNRSINGALSSFVISKILRFAPVTNSSAGLKLTKLDLLKL